MVSLDDFPPYIAWPLLLVIVSLIFWLGNQILDDNKSDSAEVKEIINNSKQGFVNFQEGIEDANELRKILPKPTKK
jgi:hypothetical protein